MSQVVGLRKHRVDAASSKGRLLPPTAGELTRLAKKSRTIKPEVKPTAKAEYIARNLRRRLGTNVIEDLVARYKAGEHTTDLSREFGISRTGLRELLLEEGVEFRRQPINEGGVARAVHLYESGMTIKEVVEQLGYSCNTVRSALRAEGVVMRAACRRKRDS